MQLLPIGIQTFEDIRTGNFVYVDKTAHLLSLVQPAKGYYFLSRPRRFGKSVLISTLQALFQGKKDLFQDLAIARSNYNFQEYAVLRFDFSIISHSNGSALESGILHALHHLASGFGLELNQNLPIETAFADLIRTLGKKQRVVILIDEYDKPIIEHVDCPEVVSSIRAVLRRFYSVLKSLDSVIRFVLVTGVAQFGRVSIFSDLNNLNDLTLSEEAATLVGWTDKEIDLFLEPHIKEFARKLKVAPQIVRTELRKMYNGYRFSESEETVYNPWSVLNALQKKAFRNFWYTTGSPDFLIKILRNRLAEPGSFEMKALYDYKISADMPPAFDMERLNLITLLFQTGYLTIKRVSGSLRDTSFHLGFPNHEVEQSLLFTTLESLSPIEAGQSGSWLDKLEHALENTDFDTFFSILTHHFFANIPYELHIPRERYYQTIFHTIFLLLNVRIRAEEKTNKGAIDHVIELADKVFIFEFKFQGSAKAALQQIRDKQYQQKYLNGGKTVYGIGVDFREKNIGEWLVETYESPPPGEA